MSKDVNLQRVWANIMWMVEMQQSTFYMVCVCVCARACIVCHNWQNDTLYAQVVSRLWRQVVSGHRAAAGWRPLMTSSTAILTWWLLLLLSLIEDCPAQDSNVTSPIINIFDFRYHRLLRRGSTNKMANKSRAVNWKPDVNSVSVCHVRFLLSK